MKPNLRIAIIMCLSAFLYSCVVVSGNTSKQEGSDNGVVTLQSRYPVAQTIDRLQAALEKKGMTIFTSVDHKAGAETAGLSLRPTRLLIFGNPKIGTRLMQCNQQAALDLPQKALAWEDAQGRVFLSYNAPAYLANRYDLQGCDAVVNKISGALRNFANAATQ